jgi:hypothetical protein
MTLFEYLSSSMENMAQFVLKSTFIIARCSTPITANG